MNRGGNLVRVRNNETSENDHYAAEVIDHCEQRSPDSRRQSHITDNRRQSYITDNRRQSHITIIHHHHSQQLGDGKRSVGLLLGLGILLLPFVFSWFTLRKGHSNVSRVVSFVWLGLSVFASCRDFSKNMDKNLATSVKIGYYENHGAHHNNIFFADAKLAGGKSHTHSFIATNHVGSSNMDKQKSCAAT